MEIDLWPLIVYAVLVIGIVFALMGVSALMGEKRRMHSTDVVYESGVPSTGSAHLKIAVPFYLTAILFIIFDLEAVFLFAWAISIREAGWLGFAEVFIFIFILIAGLLYLWRSGALEWRTERQQTDKTLVMGDGGVVNVKKEVESSHNQGEAH